MVVWLLPNPKRQIGLLAGGGYEALLVLTVALVWTVSFHIHIHRWMVTKGAGCVNDSVLVVRVGVGYSMCRVFCPFAEDTLLDLLRLAFVRDGIALSPLNFYNAPMSPRATKILLIEGQRSSLESLLPILQSHGTIEVAHTGTAAFRAIEQEMPQLVLFDASTMRSSGVRNCQRLRQRLPDTPFIHVRDDQNDPPDLDLEVFLQRPFTPRKLHNRIRALLPADETAEQVVRLGHLTLFLGKRSIRVGEQGEQMVTPKVAQLLEQFLRHPNEILSRRDLMESVWQTSYIGDTRTLDVHVRWIREIIETEPNHPTLLATVRGVGYMLQWPTLNGA